MVTEHKLGARFSKPDVRDYKMRLVCGDINLPEKYECPNMPEVKNQGNVCSCVAHALAVIVEWHSRRQGDSSEEMSTAFIYGNRLNSLDKDQGMFTRDAIDAVTKCGTCEKRYMPKNLEVPAAIKYFEENYFDLCDKAYKYRFTEYARVDKTDEVKTALIKYGPMAIAMNWYSDITWSGQEMIMQTTQKRKNLTGGHCMVLYGYNNIGWLVQNSWGSDWGTNNGRCIIPYNVSIREAYQIVDDYSEAQQKKRISELEKINSEYSDKIDKLNDEIAKLNVSLNKFLEYKELTEEQRKQIEELTKKLEECNSTISELRQKIDEHNSEIEILKNKLLEIKKPFKSSIGALFAKIINAIITAVNYLFSKVKN